MRELPKSRAQLADVPLQFTENQDFSARSIITHLLGESCVVALHDTNGRWDLLVELRVWSLQQLSTVLKRVRLTRGIQTSETSIHLATYRG